MAEAIEFQEPRVLFTAEEIDAKIAIMAQQLVETCADDDPLFLSLMMGAAPFATDLLARMAIVGEERELDFHPKTMPLTVSSYRNGFMQGRPHLLTRMPPRKLTRGRRVIILDDLHDSGKTLSFVEKKLYRRGARSVEAAVAVLKVDNPHSSPFTGKLLHGFESPYGEWLFGFGMNGIPQNPDSEAGRWLPDIWIAEKAS